MSNDKRSEWCMGSFLGGTRLMFRRVGDTVQAITVRQWSIHHFTVDDAKRVIASDRGADGKCVRVRSQASVQKLWDRSVLQAARPAFSYKQK